ncbi:MAG: threonine synthase [Burkholderiaceae bacterium]
MQYLSTRGGMPAAGFTEILLGGLAPDGGLVVPEHYPRIDMATLAGWRELDYPALAFEILSRYVGDIEPAALRDIIDRTYTPEVFGTPEITPLERLEPELFLLRLSNGPTLAFKDLAMQLLGNLFEYQLAREGRQLNILGATSGDTGSAAEYAMRGKQGVRVFMLSPDGRMSAFQRAQMFSLHDANIFNIAIDGVFDDCQDLVKAVSADLGFKRRYAIGTVNSINWARVVAQVVYYFKAWLAVAEGEQPVSFCVPSGNFGNVLAGHIARMMGLPIARLVVATNENDVLDEFFRTGRYRVRGSAETYSTSSPSMDISKASNFERFVFDLLGRDPARLDALWKQLDADGGFDIGGSDAFAAIAEFGFASGRSTHADRMRTIRELRERQGMLVDTHTADGLFVAQGHREEGVPMICLETALPAKFADAIREATGFDPEPPVGFAGLEQRVQRYVRMPADVVALKRYIAAHCA